MITFILRYWEIILAVIVTAFTAWILHSADVQRIENQNHAALASQQAALEKSFAENNKITEDSTREYQSKISALNLRVANTKRMRENYCIVPISSETSGSFRGPSGPRHANQNGIPVERFYDYAGTCERLRIQVISLQDFIDKTYTGVQ